MTRAEFSRRILFMGGTYADVNRLDEEGYESARDVYGFMLKEMGEAEFSAICYGIGREFVLNNMGDLFSLENPENAKERSKINRWNYIMRNIGNIALCLSDYAGNNEYETDGITWGDIGVAETILSNLKDVCEIANIKVEEV